MATAVGKILLTLQTKATQGGFTDLLSFGTIFGKVARKIKEHINDVIEFNRQYDVLAGSIRGADKVSKGLVDTTNLMTQRNALHAAGLKVTAEEFEKLTKFAAAQAQVMGKDVDPAFTQFFASLTSGRTTALKKFGLELKETSTVSKTFAAVMEQVTERVDEMHVEVRDPKDAWFAFKNNVGTSIGLIVGLQGEMGVLNDVFTEVNSTLGDFNIALEDAEKVGVNFRDFAVSFLADMWEGFNRTTGLFDELTAQIMAVDEALRLRQYNVGAFRRKKIDLLKERKQLKADIAALDRAAAAKARVAAAKAAAKPTKGKGRRRGPEDISAFTLEETELLDLESMMTGGITDEDILQAGFLAEFIGRNVAEAYARGLKEGFRTVGKVELPFGLGGPLLPGEEAAAGLGIEDIREKTFEEKMNVIKEERAEEFALEVEHKDLLFEMEFEASERSKQLQEEKHLWLLANSEEYAEKQREINMAERHDRVHSVGRMFGDLSTLMEVENKKAWNIGKSMMLSEAILSSIVSAEKAWQRGMEIPFAGMVLAPLFSTASLAASAIRIAAISAMEYKGGAKGAAGGKMSVSSGTSNLLGNGAQGAGNQRPQIINVRLGADTLISALINEGKERDRAGVETIEIKGAA